MKPFVTHPPGFDEALRRIAVSPFPVFFVGSHKNSGKTTAFMRTAHSLHERGKALVLASLGRDGEARDQFFGHEKPLVSLAPGMRFITILPATPDVAARLVAPLPGFVDGRQLGLFEAVSCGNCELWGPPSAAELRRVLDAAHAFLPENGILLVDGALDRQAALYQGECALVLCCKAVTPNPLAFGIHLSARRALLEAPLAAPDALPCIEVRDATDFGALPPDAEVSVDGPLTQAMAEGLLAASVKRVVVESPMHVFCQPETIQRLAGLLQVRSRPHWLATAVNPAGSPLPPHKILEQARNVLAADHPVFDALQI